MLHLKNNFFLLQEYSPDRWLFGVGIGVFPESGNDGPFVEIFSIIGPDACVSQPNQPLFR
jgi:hypothetical protein